MRKSAVIGMSFLAVFIFVFCFGAEAFLLPDTGQTKCYEAVSPYIQIPCAGTGQDGAYSISPMSFKDNRDGTITDINTGLMWQKEDDGNMYNWFEAVGLYDAEFNPGSVNVCGELSLGDLADWRLPAKKELLTLVDYSVLDPGPKINPVFFPNSEQNQYWTSTVFIASAQPAWQVDFRTGLATEYGKKWRDNYVRCVRGQSVATALTDNEDGTVSDSRTGLMWQQGEGGAMTWAGALSYCEGLGLAGRADWRLPNIKELESISVDTRHNPAIDTGMFPFYLGNTAESNYWSSTSSQDENGGSYGWFVHFFYGDVDDEGKNNPNFVRCVRGGNYRPSVVSLTPSEITSAAGGGRTFTAVYKDLNGLADLKTVDLRVSPDGRGAGAIWARYNKVTNKLLLYNDAGNALIQASCAPGSPGSLQNSQGRVSCAMTTVSATGSSLTVKWRVIPKEAFADSLNPRIISLRAADKKNSASAWAQKGSWTILP